MWTKSPFLAKLGVVTVTVSVTLLIFFFVPPVMAAASYPLTASDNQVADALDYLRGVQSSDGSIGSFASSAWVAMAIAAAGEDPNTWQKDSGPSIVDYLATNAATANSAADYARMAMAAVAAGAEPESFGGRDFVTLLRGEYDRTRGC